MDNRSRAYAAVGAIVGIFLLVQLGALALVTPFKEAGYQAVDDPQDPANSIAYVFFILVMTGVMLAIIRYDVQWLLRLLLVWTGAYICLYVLTVLVPAVVVVPVDGFEINAVAWAGAIALGVALWTYPEWYVIDIAGVVMGAGAAALFGISFGVLPALILLTVLAVYDAISVYGTEHMLTLASGVMELKVPIVLVVPLSLSYSYLDAEMPDPKAHREGEDGGDADGGDESSAETAAVDGDAASDAEAVDESVADESPEAGDESDDLSLDREALFIGLGDAVIPTVLVASASFFAPESVPTVDLPGLTASVPSLTALVGTMVGLVILLRMVLKGRAHAGLPLLNGGAIAGYLIGALASGLSLVAALGLDPYL
jgi:presenilin-like A22 family membrane protease